MKRTEWQLRHIKRVEFAIQLCRLDLGQLREGALLDLKQDLVNFFIDGGLNFSGLKPDDFTNKMVQDIQASFREQLSTLAFRREDSDQKLKRLPVITKKLDAKVSLIGWFPGEPFFINSEVVGGLEQQMLQKLFEYISRSGFRSDQLRICSRANCEVIFLSKKAPRANVNLHCSITCSRQDATERYRAKQREKGKARYRKKIAARYPKAPVGRNKMHRS